MSIIRVRTLLRPHSCARNAIRRVQVAARCGGVGAGAAWPNGGGGRKKRHAKVAAAATRAGGLPYVALGLS